MTASLSDVVVTVLQPGVPGALCLFMVVVAATGRPVWGWAVALMGLAGRVRLL